MANGEATGTAADIGSLVGSGVGLAGKAIAAGASSTMAAGGAATGGAIMAGAALPVVGVAIAAIAGLAKLISNGVKRKKQRENYSEQVDSQISDRVEQRESSTRDFNIASDFSNKSLERDKRTYELGVESQELNLKNKKDAVDTKLSRASQAAVEETDIENMNYKESKLGRRQYGL